jgi:tetratricopeptide (TPR) repeat protein
MDKIDKLVSENNIQEALTLINQMIDGSPESDELYFRRGKLYWRMGDRSAAMGDYAKAQSINPDSPASKALEMAYDVANFFNPDLYNP